MHNLIECPLLHLPDFLLEALQVFRVRVERLLRRVEQLPRLQRVLGRLAVVLLRVLVDQLDVVKEIVPENMEKSLQMLIT
jgi:hypothetical protein